MKSIFRRYISYLADFCIVSTIAILSFYFRSENQIALSVSFLAIDLFLSFFIGFHYGNDAHRESISRKLDELAKQLTQTTKDNN